MTDRNLSPQEMFVRLAAEHVPTFHFAALDCPDFEAWKAAATPEVLATLGDFPERVPLNPELLVEWEQDGLHKQRWVIDVAPHISATLLVNVPGMCCVMTVGGQLAG